MDVVQAFCERVFREQGVLKCERTVLLKGFVCFIKHSTYINMSHGDKANEHTNTILLVIMITMHFLLNLKSCETYENNYFSSKNASYFSK